MAEIVSCLFCGRSRGGDQRQCECGEQKHIASVPGGFYERLMGVQQDKARRDRVFEMRRRTKLVLRREPDNAYDPNAIAVFDSKRTMLGYVPKGTAAWLAPKIDAGEEWQGNVAKVLGRDVKNAEMVMFLHLPGVELPERDAWYTPLGEDEPEFYTAARERNQQQRAAAASGTPSAPGTAAKASSGCMLVVLGIAAVVPALWLVL